VALEQEAFLGIVRAVAAEHQRLDVTKEQHGQPDPDRQSHPELADEHPCEKGDKHTHSRKEEISQVGRGVDAQ